MNAMIAGRSQNIVVLFGGRGNNHSACRQQSVNSEFVPLNGLEHSPHHLGGAVSALHSAVVEVMQIEENELAIGIAVDNSPRRKGERVVFTYAGYAVTVEFSSRSGHTSERVQVTVPIDEIGGDFRFHAHEVKEHFDIARLFNAAMAARK